MKITELSAIETGRLIAAGKISAYEAAVAALDEIESANGGLNAFITVTRATALRTAANIDRRIASGEMLSPLAGVPIAVKDNICTNETKTTCGSKMLSDFIPKYDAAAVKHLRAAGMIIVGKTNMDEFAMGSASDTSYFGAVHNPWDTRRSPGGSSGGSAAAVAARLVPCALGSDTGGSIRQPAAMCGVCGMKPTYGAVSRYGLIAYASSLDQIGVAARSASDCAALLDIISAADTHDGTYTGVLGGFSLKLGDSVKGRCIGIPRECVDSGVDEDVRASTLAAADVMRSLGATVEYFDMPMMKYVVPCYYIISNAEASSNLSRFDGVKYAYRAEQYTDVTDMITASRSKGFGAEVKKRIMLGTFAITAENYDNYYKKAMSVKTLISDAFNECFKRFDVIMCPTAPSTAGVIGVKETDTEKSYLADIFTVSANLAGLPAISVPCGFDKSGLPIGVQFIGGRMADASVLMFADAYQRVTYFHKATVRGAVRNV